MHWNGPVDAIALELEALSSAEQRFRWKRMSLCGSFRLFQLVVINRLCSVIGLRT